jgi:hypothetical protein
MSTIPTLPKLTSVAKRWKPVRWAAVLIFVDHLHLTGRPPQLDSPVAKTILPFRAFTILNHLQGG